jgi:hypothetical protein
MPLLKIAIVIIYRRLSLESHRRPLSLCLALKRSEFLMEMAFRADGTARDRMPIANLGHGEGRCQQFKRRYSHENLAKLA